MRTGYGSLGIGVMDPLFLEDTDMSPVLGGDTFDFQLTQIQVWKKKGSTFQPQWLCALQTWRPWIHVCVILKIERVAFERGSNRADEDKRARLCF